MRIAKGTLLGIRRLRTLLETTTVGDTAKNAGNELGVVHKTEAVKQCVLLAEIDVQPGIKRVAMLIELGGIGEIARNPSTGRQGIELQELDGIWVKSPFLMPPAFSEKSAASSLSLRKNSQTAPCSSLVPDLIVAFRTAAPERPNSALKPVV